MTVPAIFFHPDAIEGDGRTIVGRRAAGTGFLRGWLRHAGGDEVRVLVDRPAEGETFRDTVRSLGETRPLRVMALRRGGDFTRFGCVFFPTPGFQNAHWLRLRQGASACSLVGVTHTVSTRRIVEAMCRLLAEPVQEWDAVICTSHAVRSVVAAQFDAAAAFYRDRFGAVRVPQPQLPVIPLGVDADAFAPRAGGRAAMRAAQGVPDAAVVVLTMGRLAVVEKANPVPLMLALQQVAVRTGRDIHLWLTGWAATPEEGALHREAAALCPGVTVRMLDGRDEAVRRDVWAGADIFTLPADSVQETFGLVPVEAMAAGLPVVMPDWDGFRDTVRHGLTGFLIPTRMAPPGAGEELAARFADGRDSYLQHLTLVQSQVQIDVPAYAAALEALVMQPDLRARMGAAAAAHVRAHLDWGRVIPQYLDLARDLADRRGTVAPQPRPSPLDLDPFAMYADYPTAALGPRDIVRGAEAAAPGDLALHDRLSGRDLYRRHVVASDDLTRVRDWLGAHGSAEVAVLADGLGLPLGQTMAAVLTLAKSDLVRLPSLDPRTRKGPP